MADCPSHHVVLMGGCGGFVHDESALSSLAEHHEHDEHAEHAVVGCIPAIAFRSIDSMNGIPAILCLVGLVSCIRCVLYRVSTCTRNTIAQSPMLTSYTQTHSAAIHVHRRSARVIRLQACNDLTTDRTMWRSRCATRALCCTKP